MWNEKRKQSEGREEGKKGSKLERIVL